MEQKFGKVFIVEEQVAANGETTSRQILLDSVRFSNLDHKWYYSEMSLSPQHEKYKGRPISLQFTIVQPDKDGQQPEFTVKVPLPLKLGELKPQDLESVPEEIQKKIELYESLGMLSADPNDHTHRVVRDSQTTEAIALMCPGWKISDIKCYHALFDPYLVLDEFADKENFQENTPFKLAHTYISAMSHIVEGKATVAEVLKKFSNLPDQFKRSFKGLVWLRDELAKNTQHANPTYLALRDYHEGAFFENCSEWKKEERKNSAIYRGLKTSLRLSSVAAESAFEAIAFDQDVVIGETVRQSFLFRSLINVFLQHSSLVNDLWSCRKEMAAGETTNAIYIYHCRKGLSLENAYRKIIHKIEQTTQILTETAEMLIGLYGEEHPEITKVVEIVKNLMYGNIQWSTFNKRYNPDSTFTYDCVVELM